MQSYFIKLCLFFYSFYFIAPGIFIQLLMYADFESAGDYLVFRGQNM
jgi:hypothetical protein